jgi:hypothetical protein
MITFIKQIEEDEEWYFKPAPTLDFSILKTIDYCSFFNQKTTISVQVQSSETAEEPSQKQIETLHFILNHQEEILHSIFNFNQQSIYPIYNQSIDIDEDEIVNSPEQLARVYGVKRLEIPNLNNLESFYFLIRFDFRYDDEHGLYFVFKDTSVIDFFGEGDKNHDAIFES